MAEIWYGRSDDGLSFVMDEGPVIFPGPDLEDLDGCEDPTVMVADGRYLAWYTGWNERQGKGRLLFAEGTGPRDWRKRGIALDSSPDLKNPKEATTVRTPTGAWKLFFEFARGDASAIGLAESSEAHGPWSHKALDLPPRPQSWDSWHLSTGPIIGVGSKRPIMFYNGASRDAHWRIGWVAFDSEFERVIDRGIDPLIAPSLGKLKQGWTDIAFAASATETGHKIWLYYSIADREMLRAQLSFLQGWEFTS